MDLVQPESDLTEEDELELLELALAQSKMAVDNLEQIIRQHWKITPTNKVHYVEFR